MTLTAMRPDSGLSKGREVSLWSDAQDSSLFIIANDGRLLRGEFWVNPMGDGCLTRRRGGRGGDGLLWGD